MASLMDCENATISSIYIFFLAEKASWKNLIFTRKARCDPGSLLRRCHESHHENINLFPYQSPNNIVLSNIYQNYDFFMKKRLSKKRKSLCVTQNPAYRTTSLEKNGDIEKINVSRSFSADSGQPHSQNPELIGYSKECLHILDFKLFYILLF